MTALQNRNQHKCDTSPFGDECPKGEKCFMVFVMSICANLIHTSPVSPWQVTVERRQAKSSMNFQVVVPHTPLLSFVIRDYI